MHTTEKQPLVSSLVLTYGPDHVEEDFREDVEEDFRDDVVEDFREESEGDVDDEKPHNKIGYVGSLAIAINSLAGPAVLQLPFQYQQSGFFVTTLCLCGVATLSIACSLYICNVVGAIPASANVDRPVELSTVVDYFWHHNAYFITQWLFFACKFCMNVAAMIDTAQVVDTTIGVSGLSTVGWSPQEGFLSWSHPKCSRKQVKAGHCDPFVYKDGASPSGPILSLGYVITASVFCPLCLMDLKENTSWQIGGCFLLLTLCAYFCFAFLQKDSEMMQQPMTHLDGFVHAMQEEWPYYTSNLHVPRNDSIAYPGITGFVRNHPSSSASTHHYKLTFWGREYRDVLGVILFNFALVLALPAWLHTKRSNVKVTTVVYGSTLVSTLLYIAVGTTVAWSIPHAHENMLAPMVSGAFGDGIRLASSLFCFFVIGLDIPLFSVLTRYNLSKLLPRRTFSVNALVVYIPWATSWLFYQGEAVAALLDWGGVLVTSAIAFLLPLYLALRVLLYTDLKLQEGVTSSRHQQIRTVTAWLIVTILAVVVAIGGQAAA